MDTIETRSGQLLPRGVDLDAFAERIVTLLDDGARERGRPRLGTCAAHGTAPDPATPHRRRPRFIEASTPEALRQIVTAEQMKVDVYSAQRSYGNPRDVRDGTAYHGYVEIRIQAPRSRLHRAAISVMVRTEHPEFIEEIAQAIGARSSVTRTSPSAARPPLPTSSQRTTHGLSPTPTDGVKTAPPARPSGSPIDWKNKGIDGAVSTAASLLATLIAAAIIGG
ncbi:hypothetical protein [Microbacterium sp. NPDC058389]|uniref:hypothetical protein n=1 Tax=Microbacterium sp. NPDC058389 TaxID=3346475 RepID=UPI003657A766